MTERRNAAGRGAHGTGGVARTRKVQVVAAVQGGIIGLHDALRRYELSLEEFVAWEREVGRELADRRREGRLRELTRFVRSKPHRRPH